MRCAVVMALMLGGVALAQPREAERPPELKIFDRYPGIWEGKITSHPAEWNKLEQSGKAFEEYQWALGNAFMHGKTYGESGGMMAMSMWGYDAGNKTYRLWFFGVAGIATMWEGTWNEETQTLTLKTDLTAEITSTATIKFIDANNREQVVITKGSDGKLYQHVVAKMTRRKK